MILIGVVVVGMIIVNVVIFSTPTQTRIPSLQASMTNTSTLITIVHQGGDSIPLGQFKILVDGVDQTANFVNSGSYPWTIGETLSYNDPSMPHSAVMIYNGTGTGGVVLLQTKFPWGVYVPPTSGGSGSSGGGGSPTTTTPASFPWYDCAWGYRKNITIDHTKVSATQSNFPVLVSLTGDSDLSKYALANGNDILFTAADGTTKLSHEIEYLFKRHACCLGEGPVPELNYRYHHYDVLREPRRLEPAGPGGTWSNGYAAVWHLKEIGTGNPNDYNDSSMNGNNGQAGGGTAGAFPTQIAGKIGYGQSFNGASDYIATNISSWYNNPQTFTQSIWFETSSPTSGKLIGFESIQNGTGAGQYDKMIYTNTAGNAVATIWSGGTITISTSTAMNDGNWHYAVFTYGSGTLNFYVDGNFIGQNSGTAQSYIGWLRMGSYTLSGWPLAANGYYSGSLDEAHYSSVVRSSTWISTEWANQNSPSTFYTVGSPVSSPCSGTTTTTPTPTPGPWYDCNWGYRKRITIDHTKVIAAQSDFPVLVSLTSDSGLQAYAQSEGDDIFFTAADGTTRLSHEIEYYSAGTLVAWVKVPALSSTTDTVIYMYYGNPSAHSQQNKNDVWSNGYAAVWHLREAGTGQANDYSDSTSNANNGQGGGGGSWLPNQTPGKIGFGQTFSPNDYIQGPNPAPSLEMTSQVTMEAWVNLANANNNQKIVGKTTNLTITGGYLLAVNSGQLYPEFWDTTGTDYTFTAGIIPSNTWTHLAATWTTGGNMVGYINGAQIYTTAASSKNLGMTSTSGYTRIGATPWRNPPLQFFTNGLIDEVRLSNIARSPQWIATEYTNENNPSTFYTVASQEPAPCTPPTIVPTVTPTPTPSTPWYPFCSWGYRKNITINSANVVGTQTNFPVLVSLTADSDLSAHARSDGNDILFTQSDGQTAIPYEREYYNAGTLIAWVNVPSITSAANTTIYMYYGNLASPDMSHQNQTWDANYMGVWHLSPNLIDSTSNANAGTNVGSTDTGGEIYRGRTFASASKQYIDSLNNSASGSGLNITTNSITAEAWINANSWATWYNGADIASKEDWNRSMTNGYVLRVGHNPPTTGSGAVDFNIGNNSANAGWVESYTDGYMNTGQWYLVAGTYNGISVATFINGHAKTNLTNAGGNSAVNDSKWNFNIGDSSYSRLVERPVSTTGRYFNGIIDEVRISKTARSDSWISTEYNNENSPSTFYSVGKEEALSCGAGPAYVQSRSLHFGSASQASITLPGSSTTGDLLVLSFLYDNPSRTISSVTDTNGNLYIQIPPAK